MSDEALDRRATLLAHLLVQTRHVDSLIDDVWAAWEKVYRDGLTRPGTTPRVQTNEDRQRLRFEVSCFGAFLLMEEVVPTAFHNESLPDSNVSRFNRTFGMALITAAMSLMLSIPGMGWLLRFSRVRRSTCVSCVKPHWRLRLATRNRLTRKHQPAACSRPLGCLQL